MILGAVRSGAVVYTRAVSEHITRSRRVLKSDPVFFREFLSAFDAMCFSCHFSVPLFIFCRRDILSSADLIVYMIPEFSGILYADFKNFLPRFRELFVN